MAVPDLSGPLVRIQEMRSQRGENAKQREHERSQALKQFGMSIGKAAFDTLADVGLKAYDEKLKRPYELADRGVSEYDLPAPDMKKAVMASPLSQYFNGTGALAETKVGTPAALSQPSVAKPAAAPTEPARVNEPQATKPTPESIKARRIEAARRRVARVEDRAFAQGLLKDAEAGDTGALDALEEMPLASAPAEGAARSERRDGEAYRAMGTGGGATVSPGYTPPGYSSAGRDVPVPQTEAEKEAERKAGFRPGRVEIRVRDKHRPERDRTITIPPGPPSMAAPPQVPPVASDLEGAPPSMRVPAAAPAAAESDETTPLGAGGMRGLFQNLAASRVAGNFRESRDDTMMRRLDQLDPKERAFVEAAGLKRREIEAGTELSEAQAKKLRDEVNPDSPLYRAQLGKLGAEKAGAEERTRASEFKRDKIMAKYLGSDSEKEAAKQAWNDQMLMSAARTVDRFGGSSSPGGTDVRGRATAGGGSSSGSSLPARIGYVVADDGWGMKIEPVTTSDGTVRYIARQEQFAIVDGKLERTGTKIYEYSPPSRGKDEWTPISSKVAEAPPEKVRPRPTGTGGKGTQLPAAPTGDATPAAVAAPAAPAAPDAPKTSAYWEGEASRLKARANELGQKPKMTKEEKAEYSRANGPVGQEGSEKYAVEEARKLKGKENEAVTTARRGRNDAMRNTSEGKRLFTEVATLKGTLKPGLPNAEDLTSMGLNPRGVGGAWNITTPEGVAQLKAADIADVWRDPAAAAVKVAGPEVTDATDRRKILGKAELGRLLKKDHATKRASALADNLPVLRLQYRQANPQGTVPEFLQFLGDQGVSLTAEELKSLQATLPSGPSTPTPGQLPPPPGRQSQVNPTDDLFDKINAMPWSADRKRRVFMAEAQKRGLA